MSTGRVVHAVHRYGEVSETFIRDAVRELERHGWEPWVVTDMTPVNRELYPYPPDSRVLRPWHPPAWRRALARVARRSYRSRTADRWKRQIHRTGAGLVHVHFGYTAAAIELRRLGVPVLVSFHGSDVTAWPGWSHGNRALYHELFAELPRATVVSSFIERELRELGFRGDVDLVPAGVRLGRFPFRPPPAVNGDLRLLFVGRQEKYKGLDVLLRAMPSVVGELPEARLEVIGDGPERSENVALAERLGVGRYVRFRGATPHDEVARRLAEAHLLIAPSRPMKSGQSEGSPVVTKEAQAIGTPVVATRVGGLPETLSPAFRHELVEPDDPAALTRRIVALVSDSPGWPERARTGRAWVESEFDWELLGRRLARIYDDVLDSWPHPRERSHPLG